MRQQQKPAEEPRPPYKQGRLRKPGREHEMTEPPRWQPQRYRPAGKLEGKTAFITGGDSGIGRSVAYLYSREGADVAIVYLPSEQKDAEVVKSAIEAEGRKCLLIPGDLSDAGFCKTAIEHAVKDLGRLDILVSNAAWQNRKHKLEEVSDEEWDRTFKTNVYAFFWLVKAALPHLKSGASIIATGSQVGFIGSESLPDYGATKGAIHSFTKVLAQNLIDRGIRVNAVAPGPVWTPLNPADAGATEVQIRNFGRQQPIGRAAQPEEIAPLYVFLASDADSSYVSGAIIEEMGGRAAG